MSPRVPFPDGAFSDRVLDVVSQPVTVTDAEGTILFFNRAAAETHGWSPERVLGRHIVEVMPLVASEDTSVVKQRLAQGQPWRGELLLGRGDGSTYPAVLTTSPVLDETGELTHVVAIATDVSELTALQRRLRSSFDAAPHGWAFADLFGVITEVNDAFCALLGRDSDQIVGHRPHEFTVSGDRGRLTPFDEMRSGRRPDRFQTQKRYRRGDGEIRWVDAHVRLVRDHVGRPEYFLAHVRDITDWVGAQQEAREAETQYRDLFNRVVLSIGTALELRDPYTAGHQRRVAELAAAIGLRLGLDDEVRQGLTVGAAMHDIGKVATPAEILTKPGRLDGAEYAIVQRHPRAGHDIVVGIDFPWPVATMVLQHHERVDGSGYPEGLRGDAIGLEARIIAVADTVETIVSTRPYRPAAPLEVALQVIADDRGTLFDPDAVEACAAVFDAGFTFAGSAPAGHEPGNHRRG